MDVEYLIKEIVPKYVSLLDQRETAWNELIAYGGGADSWRPAEVCKNYPQPQDSYETPEDWKRYQETVADFEREYKRFYLQWRDLDAQTRVAGSDIEKHLPVGIWFKFSETQGIAVVRDKAKERCLVIVDWDSRYSLREDDA